MNSEDELRRLKERFQQWMDMPRPSVAEMPGRESMLLAILTDAKEVCSRAGDASESFRATLEAFFGRLDRMYHAASTVPLNPFTSAVLDPSQRYEAGELARYLRAHGVAATVETLYQRVQTGWTTSYYPMPISTPVYGDVPSGIRVGPGRAYHPGTESRSFRRRS